MLTRMKMGSDEVGKALDGAFGIAEWEAGFLEVLTLG